MRKMMSIVFLLLVLIISLGLSAYMQITEGMDDASTTDIQSDTPSDVDTQPVDRDVVDGDVVDGDTDKEESVVADVTPVEDSCTETMTTYK